MKIVVLSQNVKLESFCKLDSVLPKTEKIVVLSTQKLFDYERVCVKKNISNVEFITFADLLTDKEMEWCDSEAFTNTLKKAKDDLGRYYKDIKSMKNDLVIKHLAEKYGEINGYICANDLGIDKDIWLQHGFEYFPLDYYYSPNAESRENASKEKQSTPQKQEDEIYVSWWNGEKYVFLGSLNRIGYRMQMKWQNSEEESARIKNKQFETAEKCHYLTTLHEFGKCRVPDDAKYDVRYIQDGYLPPNYTGRYLKFVPRNVKYYAWDRVGLEIFKNQGIAADVMPFRERIHLPKPHFGEVIKKILIVTSGAGDWTAIKNRSDEDCMVEGFGIIAREFPDIKFVYRCHPLWLHPEHQGVNSISRVAEYFEHTGLMNIKISSNIPVQSLNNFKLSLPRNSMEKDLEGADLVVGEHSIAMIDGAMRGIPFASLNLTGRRNLFCGISDFGFPHFESVEGLMRFIRELPSDLALQESYRIAVDNYNKMVDED